MTSSFFKENITAIKYGLIVINLFFMIIAIKAVVNYQTIVSSIDQVRENIETTKEHTDYINNFLTPYLNSEYAQYFLSHENNQLFAGETIVKIITVESGSLLTTSGDITTLQKKPSEKRISAPTARQKFFSKLTEDIVWKR